MVPKQVVSSNNCKKYEFLFYTKVMINIFEGVELLNAELQKISFNFHEVKIKIKLIISLIEQQRESGFDNSWLEISTKAREQNTKELNNQRPKKTPNIFIQNSELGSPSSALLVKEKFKLVYYQIIYVIVSALNSGFR